MPDLISSAAEAYAADHTTPFSGATRAATDWTAANSSSPQMMAGLAEARLLELLVVTTQARHVLEIGAFTGVGALSLAAALPEGGRVTTLEVDEDNAVIAQRHIDASPYADRIEIIVGDALQTLERLDGPFDVVWIDAWKPDYPAYYEAVVPKLSPGGVIAADNVFRTGRVLDADATDEGVLAIQAFNRQVAEDSRTHNVLLTIGDGVMLAWHRPARATD
jgi:caffeoyl-CoA O-methyltransferase